MNFKELAENYFADALEDLIELVKIPSVLDEYNPDSDAPFGLNNKKALQKFLEISKKLGFETENARNFAGSAVFGEGKEILGILGHLDVVPAIGKWTFGPFNPTVSEGKLYGRGTLDDKGGVIASLYAMKLLKDQGFKPNKQIKLIAGCDEETGSRCLAHYLDHFKMPDLAFSPDAEFPAIYGEKAILTFDIEGELDNEDVLSFDGGLRYNIVIDKAELEVKEPNITYLYAFLMQNPNINAEIIDNKYVFHGKGAHAATPELGENAAYNMFKFMNQFYPTKISEFAYKYLDEFGKKAGIDLEDKDMGKLTLNLGIAKTEDKHFKLGLNLRVPTDSHIEFIKQRLLKLLKGTNFKITHFSFAPVHFVSPDSFLVKNLVASYQEETGDIENKPFVIGGGTYAKAIPNAIAFGPCFPHREDICHEPDEHIYLDDFALWIAIYANAIYKLTK